MNNNKKDTTVKFDFKAWAELAEKDPGLFEQEGRQAVQSLIKSAPPHMWKRLNGLQWRVDTEILRADNPMDACLRVYRMMMDLVYSPGGLLESLNSLHSDQQHPTPVDREPGRGVVVEFPVQTST